jgi:predicted  nucleic acid-binding Zn-ribbon protein
VSDTPRTDAEAFWPHDSQYKVCDAVFARQLEGELNAANDRIKELEAKLDELHDLEKWLEGR